MFKIDIPFTVELYPDYSHLLTQDKLLFDVPRIARDIAVSYRLKDPNDKPYISDFEVVARYFEGEWTVVGTSDSFGTPCFVLLKEGESVVTIPVDWCRVVKTPIVK